MRSTIRIFSISLLTTISVCLALIITDSVEVFNHKKLERRAQSAFVQIVAQQEVMPRLCIAPDNPALCPKILATTEPFKNSWVASGAVVETVNGRAIITAGHACIPRVVEKITYKNVTITSTSKFDIKVIFPLTGKMHVVEISKLDTANDLCLLKAQGALPMGLRIAKNKPILGEAVKTYSAPLGISSPGMILNFDGRYSGESKLGAFYTLPTRKGASGSVVLDENYRGVGIITSAVNGIEAVGIGAGHGALRKFLDLDRQSK